MANYWQYVDNYLKRTQVNYGACVPGCMPYFSPALSTYRTHDVTSSPLKTKYRQFGHIFFTDGTVSCHILFSASIVHVTTKLRYHITLLHVSLPFTTAFLTILSIHLINKYKLYITASRESESRHHAHFVVIGEPPGTPVTTKLSSWRL